MRGTFESGTIETVDEVRVNEHGMYYGVISKPGQGRRQTELFNDKREANTALDTLRKSMNQPRTGISAKQAADFAAALDGIGGA